MKRIKNKSYVIMLFSIVVLFLSTVVISLSQSKKVDVSKQKVEMSSEAPINYEYGISYEDKTYGIKIEFPASVKTYKFKEYKWTSHENIYNPTFDKTFATANNKFNFYTGNFYLSYDNPQTLGDLISYRVYDIKNKSCNDGEFCQNYVFSKETSGMTKGESEPFSFWMRSDKYLVMFGILGEEIKSANSKYKLSVY